MTKQSKYGLGIYRRTDRRGPGRFYSQFTRRQNGRIVIYFLGTYDTYNECLAARNSFLDAEAQGSPWRKEKRIVGRGPRDASQLGPRPGALSKVSTVHRGEANGSASTPIT
jgi:hypothetical protein